MVNSEIVLEHDTRRMIYNHINTNPGVSFNILKTIFELNDSTLRYHLNYLERNEKISFGLERGKRYYYPHVDNRVVHNNGEDFDTLKTHNLSEVQEHIIRTIKRNPGINQKELIRRTGNSRLTINRNIKKLMDLCVVRKTPNANKVCYEYIENEQLRYQILKRLLIKLVNKEIDEETFLKLKRSLE